MAIQDYFNAVYRDARVLGCNHVQATLCATQSSMETGWGKNVKGNSYFGIKAGKSWTGKTVDFTTHEVINGKRIKIVDSFRAYENQKDSIKDYSKTMSEKWPDAWSASNIENAARGLLTGIFGAYATDPTYMDGVWKTGRKRGPIARALYEGKSQKKEPDATPEANIAQKGRPQQVTQITQIVIRKHLHFVPKSDRNHKTFFLAVRGYFRDSKGAKGKNDRGLFDDALFVSSPRGVWSFNANVDPSVYRKRVASYKNDQAISFKQGIHGHSKPKSRRYRAFEQVSQARIHRDQTGEDYGDFSMNIHRGSSSGSTSSLGCITVPYGAQWDDFFKRACTEMDSDNQKLVWLILLEYQGGKPPLSETDTATVLSADPIPSPVVEQPIAAKTDIGLAFGDLRHLDEIAFRAINELDLTRQNNERSSYYDGYATGIVEMASKIRRIVRKIDPEFDKKNNQEGNQ